MSCNPNTARQVCSIVARMQRIPEELVTIDKTFEDLNLDSLDGINLVFEIENAFEIQVPDEAARQIRTVRELVDGVDGLLAARNEAASS